MANVCERCKRSMSSHGDHASCPQCRISAGESCLDLENLCNFFFVGMDFQTVGETEKVLGGRQSGSQPARETALGLQPSLDSKHGFLSKPVSASGSGPTSEISSHSGEDDLEDNLLVSTPNQQFEPALVVQAQNGVNMASGTATTAPSTAPLTSQSTIHIFPILVSSSEAMSTGDRCSVT